ncbi:MAG: AI-2E family transporter [Planctomycetota bacterium]|nr:AI-2E family transporter [Planctomycetota bacterium]
MTPDRRRAVRIGFVSVFLLLVLLSGYLLRSIINPLLVALLLAYILNPLVSSMEKRGIRRTQAVVGIFLIGLVCAVLFGGLGVAAIVSGIGGLSESITKDDGYFDRAYAAVVAYDWDGLLGKNLAADVKNAWGEARDKLKDNVGDMFKTLQSVAGNIIGGAVATLAGIFLLFSYLILVPVYTFFLLLSLGKIRIAVSEHLPGAYRDRILVVAAKIDRSVSAFFRGRLMICLAKGLLIAIGLKICGVKFAFAIGLLAGAGSLIPFLGGIFATVPSIILVLLEAETDPLWPIIGIGIVVIVVEAIEGLVLTPVILSKETGLHPLTLLMSIFIAGEVFGFFGVLLAVPIASIVKILFVEFVLPEIKALAKEKPAPAPDG